jgi:hypothetical protein
MLTQIRWVKFHFRQELLTLKAIAWKSTDFEVDEMRENVHVALRLFVGGYGVAVTSLDCGGLRVHLLSD